MRLSLPVILLSGLVFTSAFADNRVGDADNSGAVGMADAALVQSRLFGTVGASQVSPLALADGDGALDLRDMVLVAQAATGARVIDNPAYALSFTPPPLVATVSGLPDFVATFGVASPLPAVASLVDGLEVSFAIQPASSSTLNSPSLAVSGGTASVSVTPLAPPGGESFDVVLSVPVSDSSGGNLRDLTSNAAVTVADSNVCGNGVTDLDLPTQITLEFFGLPCGEEAYYRVWINGTQVFNQLYTYVLGDPNFDRCYGGDPCGYAYNYRSVSTTDPALLASLVDGSNSIRFQMDNFHGYYQHFILWALLKVTRPGGIQYITLYDGGYPAPALAHSTNWCEFPGDYYWDTTADYDIDLMEACDDGLANSTCGNCNANCTAPYNTCGDLVVRCGEACDDGPGGSCSDDCLGGYCGDGVVYGSEACDSGVDNGNCGFCNASCTGPHNICGDGVARCGEACDDGPGGTCHDDCTAVNVCGDGLVFAGEVCDDSVDNGTCGHCSATCNGPHNVCGDGQTLCGEACDDGDATDCGLCNATCTGASPADFCGDGVVCGAEVCDDGDATQCGLCNPFCTAASAADFCGDGLVCGTETCDDGNTNALDGCESDCQLICGAGTGAKKAALDTVSGDCFLGFEDTNDWQDSQLLCQLVSDGLATPSTMAGNAAAYLAATSNYAWIGMSDLVAEAGSNGSLFQYVNGGYVSYSGWAAGEPNGFYSDNCVQFSPSAGGAWNDAGCWQERPRVCEISHCGNGVVDSGETCDDGDGTDCGPCLGNCSGPSIHCGNAILDCEETCDDGNVADGDGCESDCQLVCGAGSGALRAAYDSLSNTCYLGFASPTDYSGGQSLCVGLGGHLAVLEGAAENALAFKAFPALPGVAAWLGFNDITTEALGNPYQFQNVLGGNLIYANFGPGEPNDAGGSEDCVLMGADTLWADIPCWYGVGSLCEIPSASGVCGDGVRNLGEACDDGDATDCGSCNANCTGASPTDYCGDGLVCGAEVCDDGDNTECGDCNAACSGPSNHCGNGTPDCGEACDDGNLVNGDGCESDCALACGAGMGAIRAAYDSPSNTCYLGFASISNYQSGQDLCVGLGGYLAVLDSAAENALAFKAFPAMPGLAAWVGFNDIAIEALGNALLFSNVLGGSLVYDGFFAGEPNDAGGNEDCALMGADGFWYDVPCGLSTGSLCEFPAAFGVCGDGVKNLDEACDDGDTTECGTCNATCTGSSPADTCGDGLVCGGEVCDDGPANGNCGKCNTSCTGSYNSCGDGIARCGEVCDDGNAVSNDGCESDCDLICGIGSGAIRAAMNLVDSTCYLGFGIVDSYLSHRAMCQDKGGYLAIIDSAAENSIALQAFPALPGLAAWLGFNDLQKEASSTPTLFHNVRGGDLVYDGFSPGEPNDAGGSEDCVLMGDNGYWYDAPCGLVTGAICEVPYNPGFCGDGIVNGAEECDDFANPNPCDGCMLNCRLTCGNGQVDCGEACDDGQVQGPGLCVNNTCTVQVCGDGTINGDEPCDDWNTSNYDGCSATCQLEPQPCQPSNVAVFRDYLLYTNPPTVEDVLAAAGIPYTVYSSGNMGSVDLSPYDKVVLPGSQPDAYYQMLKNNIGWLDSWIYNGGVLEIHPINLNREMNNYVMPGGWAVYMGSASIPVWLTSIAVANPFHPVHRFPLPMTLADYDLEGPSIYFSVADADGYFTISPPGATWLAWDTYSLVPVTEVIPHGQGFTIATLQPAECMASDTYFCNTIGPNGRYLLRNLLLHMPQQTCP